MAVAPLSLLLMVLSEPGLNGQRVENLATCGSRGPDLSCMLPAGAGVSALTVAAKLHSVPSCPLGDRHPGSVNWAQEAGPSSSSSEQPASARLLQQRQGASPKGAPRPACFGMI